MPTKEGNHDRVLPWEASWRIHGMLLENLRLFSYAGVPYYIVA
jgi:hypothetical protein